MARTTQKQAEAARDQFSEDLAKRGAHAIGIEHRGSEGWAVVAHVEPSKAFDAPATLTAKQGSREVAVPLIIQRGESFKPE